MLVQRRVWIYPQLIRYLSSRTSVGLKNAQYSMETQKKVLSHLIILIITYLEQYCFHKESLGGLAQCSGVNIVVVVCVFLSVPCRRCSSADTWVPGPR